MTCSLVPQESLFAGAEPSDVMPSATLNNTRHYNFALPPLIVHFLTTSMSLIKCICLNEGFFATLRAAEGFAGTVLLGMAATPIVFSSWFVSVSL